MEQGEQEYCRRGTEETERNPGSRIPPFFLEPSGSEYEGYIPMLRMAALSALEPNISENQMAPVSSAPPLNQMLLKKWRRQARWNNMTLPEVWALVGW
jgi:hypothetical protein